MKKIDWSKTLETIAYLAAMGIGFGILYFAFTFIWQIIKSIF